MRDYMYVVVPRLCTCMWLVVHVEYSERRKDKATQHNTNPFFPKEKDLHLRWDSNPRLTHSRRDAPPAELPRQLSWLSSNHPYSKARQSKCLNLINRYTCTHVHVLHVLASS